jgi:hypothetical protein
MVSVKYRRFVVQAGLGRKQDPISKITIAKRTRGLVQPTGHVHSSEFKP